MQLDHLGEAQRLAYAAARRFADTELRGLAAANPGDQALVKSVLPRLAEIGLLGGTFPEEVGGAGTDHISYCLVCEAIGGVSPSIFTGALTVQLSLVGTALHRFGRLPQHAALLREALSGAKVGAFALTEPDSGSDPAAAKTEARRGGDSWVINGSKLWISNGTIADFIVVFAQTQPGSRHRGMTAFIVPGNAPGLGRTPIGGKLGLAESDTASLSFDDVQVGDDARLGEVGQGFTIAQASLEVGRLSTAACAVGISQACLDISIAYAKSREQWGKPIGGHQLIQQLVAEMATSTLASRLMVHHAASAIDRGESAAALVAMAKQFATESAVENARRAISLHGGVGFVDETGIAPLLRDAIGLSLYEGTSQIQGLIIARTLLGISAFA
ncbi:MAG TPA: acyl-CoA dehydrogenase family protein [Tepidiformaceae bacterium]|nr:acyl-CoA dehydrogenase family protein [Tepidiformaceae bacterium]